MATPPTPTLHLACLCAAWCRLCDAYAQVLEAAAAQLRTAHPGLQTHWIDIEDEAELVGDLDIPTFPTLVLMDADRVLFAGPLTPQPETLLRVLRAALARAAEGAAADPQPDEVMDFAQRLRQRAAPG